MATFADRSTSHLDRMETSLDWMETWADPTVGVRKTANLSEIDAAELSMHWASPTSQATAALASLLLLIGKIAGVDTKFVHEVVVVLAGQTVSGLPVGATVEFKERASNSNGHTDSAVKCVVVT